MCIRDRKDDKEIKIVLVNGLPNIYDEKGIRRDLNKDVNDATVTIEDLKKNIHYEWKKNFKGKKPSKPGNSAYSTSGGGGEGGDKKKACPCCKKPGHSADKCFKKHPHLLEEFRKKKEMSSKCKDCGELGHYAKNCPKKNKRDGREVSFVGMTICLLYTSPSPRDRG